MSSQAALVPAPRVILALGLTLALGACGASPAPQKQPAEPAPGADGSGAPAPAPPSDRPGDTIDDAEIAAAVAKLRFRVSKQATLVAVAGARAAPLPVENVFRLAPARWSEDRSQVLVEYEDYCEQTHQVTFSARTLVAHLENADALAAFRAGRHDQAAAGFARAAALDPDFDLAYSNQAAALIAAGKAEDAAAALAPLLARAPVHGYVKVMMEPALAALRDAPALAALRSDAPGSARIDPARFALAGALAAIDPARGRIAAVDVEASWGTCRFESILQIFDAATGEALAEAPIVTWDDSDPDACDGRGLLPEARGRVSARVEAASRALRDLGFVPVTRSRPSSGSEEAHADRTAITVPFPASRLTLVIGDGTARVLRAATPVRGKKPGAKPAPGRAPDQTLVERAVPHATAVGWALHVPEVDAVIYAWQRPGAEGCEGSDPTGIVVLPLSASPSATPAPGAPAPAPGT